MRIYQRICEYECEYKALLTTSDVEDKVGGVINEIILRLVMRNAQVKLHLAIPVVQPVVL